MNAETLMVESSDSSAQEVITEQNNTVKQEEDVTHETLPKVQNEQILSNVKSNVESSIYNTNKIDHNKTWIQYDIILYIPLLIIIIALGYYLRRNVMIAAMLNEHYNRLKLG